MGSSRSLCVGLSGGPGLGLLLPAALACVAACDVPSGEGVIGERGRAYFTSEDTDLVFSQALVVGSRFHLRVQGATEADANLVAGTLRLTDREVLAFTSEDVGPLNAEVEVVGPGEAHIEVISTEDEVADRILIRAANPARLEVGDGSLQGAAVDPRLPDRFGLAEPTAVFLVGLDRCGGALLPVKAFDLAVPADGELSVERGGANDWTLAPTGLGETELSILKNGEPVAAYDVVSVAPGQISDVNPRIAAFDEDSAQVWARAFAGNVEVVGLQYSFFSSERVTLRDVEGAFTVATIAALEEGETEPPPATVELRHDVAMATLDLMAATASDVEASRVPPPEVAEPDPDTASGCSSPECNPYLGVVAGLFALRRLRRLKPMERA